jgi:hypothetical protein
MLLENVTENGSVVDDSVVNENVVGGTSKKYVCSLDVGTTTIRAFIYDENGHIKGRYLDKVSFNDLKEVSYFSSLL